MRTPDQIEEQRINVLKKINEKREQLNAVSIQIHELEKQLMELKEIKRQGRYTLSVLMTENEMLTSEYWRSKG